LTLASILSRWDGARATSAQRTNFACLLLSEHEFFEQVRQITEGRSLLLISHRFSRVKSADRIYVMHDGEIIEQGSHDELIVLGGRYAELFDMQASSYR
jgi:ATP-binding cassette subfamily B protein